MKVEEIQRHRKEWKKLIEKGNPKYVVMISFRNDINCKKSNSVIRKLLCKMRNDYFGKNKNKRFLDGFVVMEYQQNGKPHYHIVFNDNEIYQRQDRNFNDVVYKKCNSMKVIGMDEHLSIQDYYKSNLEEYLTKTVEQRDFIEIVDPECRRDNFDFISPITYSGF